MLLLSALALGLVETTNSNIGSAARLGELVTAGGGVGNGGSGSGVGFGGITGGFNLGADSGNLAINSDAVISSMSSRKGGIGNSHHHPRDDSGGIVADATMGGDDVGMGVGVGFNDAATAIATNAMVGGSSATSGTITWDNNGTLRSASPGDWSIEQCVIWQRPHHLYFQLGNAFFFLALLAPYGNFGMLWLRALIVIGCILMGMYGYLVECTPDVVLWSGLLLGVNLVYFIIALCRLRPVRFDKEIEATYEALFKPLRVNRHQFKKVLNCMKVIRSLKYQEVYAQEKVTKVDSLSLVLSGKLVVSQNQRALHIVFPHQFLDSPEWFGVSTDDYFQVSIMAMEESRVLIWHRDKLKLSIMTEPFLQTVFDHILGRDVVKKLMQVTQVSESIASNGFLPSGGYDDAEDKPMLIMKKCNEGHGLTALINRQLQEEHVPLLGRSANAKRRPPLIKPAQLGASTPATTPMSKSELSAFANSDC